jgi:hypothetical protein
VRAVACDCAVVPALLGNRLRQDRWVNTRPRIAVVTSPDRSGRQVVVLPDERIVPYDVPLSDDELRAEYSVEEVRRAEHVPWCEGVLLDGPDQGRRVYAIDRIGAPVTVFSAPPDDRRGRVYRVSRIGNGGDAELTFAGETDD